MIDFIVYVLKNSSCRDKFLGILENVTVIRSGVHVKGGERWTRLKVVEEDLSQGRKGFRLLASIPDFVHSRNVLRCFFADETLDFAKRCEMLFDAAGNFASGMWGVYDNVAWEMAVRLLRGATIPPPLATFAAAKRNEQVRRVCVCARARVLAGRQFRSCPPPPTTTALTRSTKQTHTNARAFCLY